MPSRMTATEKWIDPWFCSLTPSEKLLWLYLLDNCNHGGIWRVNKSLVEYHTGNKFPFSINFDGRIIELSKEKWFIPKFVLYQYGKLNRGNNAHKGVLKILETEGLHKFIRDWESFGIEGAAKPLPRGYVGASQGLPRGYVAHKDKDKAKA